MKDSQYDSIHRTFHHLLWTQCTKSSHMFPNSIHTSGEPLHLYIFTQFAWFPQTGLADLYSSSPLGAVPLSIANIIPCDTIGIFTLDTLHCTQIAYNFEYVLHFYKALNAETCSMQRCRYEKSCNI